MFFAEARGAVSPKCRPKQVFISQAVIYPAKHGKQAPGTEISIIGLVDCSCIKLHIKWIPGKEILPTRPPAPGITMNGFRASHDNQVMHFAKPCAVFRGI